MDFQTTAMQSDSRGSKLEKVAFYIFLLAIIISPLAFRTSPYIALELVKTMVIVLGSISAAVLLGLSVLNRGKLTLPPRSILWTGILLAISLIISSALSLNFIKSVIGQGFEIGTAGFLLTLFISTLVAFWLTYEDKSKAVIIYIASTVAFLILFIFQALRFIFGPNFFLNEILSLPNITSSIIGSWFSVGIYAGLIFLIAITALFVLSLSRKMSIGYLILAVVSAVTLFIVNDSRIWGVLALVLLGITALLTFEKSQSSTYAGFQKIKNIAWLPLVLFIVAGVLTTKGLQIAAPVVDKLGAAHFEAVLPWQATLDVNTQVIKNYPLFGVGPNHFNQAYLAYKPVFINNTDAWSIEFGNGFGLLPTFVSTQGLIGFLLWVLFFIFYGIIGVRALKASASNPLDKFIRNSSFIGSAFLWLVSALTIPAYPILFLAFILTGIFLASAVSNGVVRATELDSSVMHYGKIFKPVFAVFMVVIVLGGLFYIKKTIALVSFGGGIKILNAGGDADLADRKFANALKIDTSDIYYQARAEAALSKANRLASTVTSTTSAETAKEIGTKVSNSINDALGHARNAINFDPSNYYNYISEARVSETAATYGMQNAYENTVASYGRAAALNPGNPQIPLALSQFQAKSNKLDDSLRSAGNALQIKSNYLDAVYLLSQIYAAKGDLPNATIAAQVATQLNPNNAILHFQLGLLQFNSRDFANSQKSFAKAVELQPEYANAKYFRGLSNVRLGNNNDAIVEFTDLAKQNPDNQEVAAILSNLRDGKPIFADSPAPAPEKRPTLPIKETN